MDKKNNASETTPRYEFTFRNTAQDMWWYHMTVTYTSFAGIVNIVFTAAMIALIVSRFAASGIFFRIVMILALLIFPVFQPIAVFGRSIKETEKPVPDTTIGFDEKGMTIRVLKHFQRINYPKMNNIVKEPTLLYVLPDETHAYILTNRIVGDKKDEVYRYVRGHIIEAQPQKMTKKEKKK